MIPSQPSQYLTQPLLSSVVDVKRESDAPTVHGSVSDVESGGGGYYADSSAGEGGSSGEPKKLSKRLRLYRKMLLNHYKYWNKLQTVLQYLMYLFVVVVTVCYETHATSKDDLFVSLATFGYITWLVLVHVFGTSFVLVGGLQSWRWGGYPILIETILQAATVTLFSFAFQNHSEAEDHFPFRYFLLVSMAVSVFIEQQIVDPAFNQLHLLYRGAITDDDLENNDKVLVTGINNKILIEAAKDAALAVGIHEKALGNIERVLAGQTIRDGEEDALDDWMFIVTKLSSVVSLARAPLGCIKTKMTTLEYRNLVRQMLIYLQTFKKRGTFGKEEAQKKRTVPLSVFETLMLMFKLAWQVKWYFLLALSPGTINGVLQPLTSPLIEKFTSSLLIMDIESARQAFWPFIIIQTVVMAFLSFCKNLASSLFTTKMSNSVRKKMLNTIMRGGTAFEEVHRGGKLNDAFANQVNQMEIFTKTLFIELVPQAITILITIVVSWRVYPFAAVLLISLIPIALSVDYFFREAALASSKSTQTDGKLAGAIGSTVECRPAIRACNSGSWIEQQLLEPFSNTELAHRKNFFRAGLIQNAFETYTASYVLLIFISLGLGVFSGELSVGKFFAFMPIVMIMTGAIVFVGMASSQVAQYSGPLQTIRDLTNNNLDEEPPASRKSAQDTTALVPLANSLKVDDVTFAYRFDTPDVLKKINIDIAKGSYVVLCGGSGSGKSTVLNLLMRFREPKEGSITWDGSNIYGASLSSFREQVSVMFQKTMIYQATIRDNITFGLPERDGGVEEAAKGAEIHDVIAMLPDGYDTKIGGDSIAGMSGGQLQRICLARALYRQPSVLLLDEATSALDAVSEDAIVKTLVDLRDQKGLTLVSVSHHPSTAIEADKIVVLDNGEIAEEGKYDELASREGGIFARLAKEKDE